MKPMSVLVIAALTLLTGCGIPHDPDDTLNRVRERGEVVVGASHSEPVLVVDGDEVSGPEADLIEEWAAGEGVEVRWEPGGEEKLVRMLEHGDLDLMVGGLTAKSPWSSKVGLTREWSEDVDEYGEPVKRVVATALGENATIASLERFFDGRAA